jgi:hypothetical protein
MTRSARARRRRSNSGNAREWSPSAATRTVASDCASAIVVLLVASPARGQTRTPGPDTIAVGAGVGFLAPANEEDDSARAFHAATGTVEAFLDYRYNAHVSIRGSYGWAQSAFEGTGDDALRRQHLAVSVAYGWTLGSFRPYGSIGGGAYFLSHRQGNSRAGSDITKPGGVLGWGLEYYLRTFALRTEMSVHMLTKDVELREIGRQTPSAFTWVFGVKVPF